MAQETTVTDTTRVASETETEAAPKAPEAPKPEEPVRKRRAGTEPRPSIFADWAAL